jgi:hypothetical protein
MKMQFIEPIKDCIARTPDPDDHWLWCIECERFFHFSRLIDRDTDWPRCPFSDCQGYGWDFGIFFWDQWRAPEDEGWPSSARELRHGMRSPGSHSWKQAQQRRIATLIEAFESSAEAQGQACRYLPTLLGFSAELAWDLSDPADPAPFDPELARRLIDLLPFWADCTELSQAGGMAAELRAFFSFARRTGAVANPGGWLDILGADIVDVLRDSIRRHRRLSPRAATKKQRARCKKRRGRRRKRRRQA